MVFIRVQLHRQIFSMLVNDPDTGVEGTLSKVANSTKLGNVDSLECRLLNRDLYRLEQWAVNWCSDHDPREVPGWIWSPFICGFGPASFRKSCF